MVSLTLLRGQRVHVECRRIEAIEEEGDTRLLVLSGESIVVAESAEEVIRRIVEERRRMLYRDPPVVRRFGR